MDDTKYPPAGKPNPVRCIRLVRRLQDGDDMLKEPLADGNAYGCTLNAAGTDILLQLDDATDGEQVRVRLNRQEAGDLVHRLTRLAECLPQPPNTEVSDGGPLTHEPPAA